MSRFVQPKPRKAPKPLEATQDGLTAAEGPRDHAHRSVKVVFPEIATSARPLHVCECGKAGRRRWLIGPIKWDRRYFSIRIGVK